MSDDPDPQAISAGYVYCKEARHVAKEQPHTWRLVPGVREGIEMTLVTHLGGEHVRLHLSNEEAIRLAVALTKARSCNG